MDSALLIPIVVAIALVVIALGPLRQVRQREEHWGPLAEALGLQLQGGVLQGELQGLSVRMGLEMHKVGGEGLIQFCVVRAKAPGPLPRGFVAAPRRWTSGLGRLLADNLFASGDPALDEMYLFQCDEKDEGQAFVEDAQVQQSLRGVLGAGQVAFVEKGWVGIASMGLITDAEEARRKFEAVVRSAQGLAEARERRSLASPRATEE
ncbi:hypothetical protein [Stigmatella aurantiaca]|uniref:Uncharacterized protein n=1 Tax=Stigmatella aurantiaca (strain DW4/3-1) TaxID=378806 RepID=Q09BJ8_STIAD|nr:hypothetical protein [Stigmatella aurantiaca]ADO68994.1 uncharacterized protein STAUR_1190 [Stigmatella aurantiaca DW4/3-1]EAU69035.1 hypothetical protein STIAU_8695 [Stigmatella aurantiaca DW4/3-1]